MPVTHWPMKVAGVSEGRYNGDTNNTQLKRQNTLHSIQIIRLLFISSDIHPNHPKHL